MIIPAITNRRSIRKFAPKPVEAEKIHAVLEAARWAPSGNNMQPARFIVVRDRDIRYALTQADHSQAWMMAAPVFIVAVADLLARVAPESTYKVDELSPQWEVKRVIRDTATATGYLLLEVENQGLGACWTGFFSQEDVRPILGLPEDKFVVAIIPIGYPAESPNPRMRKSLDEIVRYEKWS
jgi:nitroreductase